MNFFDELKRRNVFRVAGVYAVVGWLLIQVAVAVFPAFGAPAWVLKVFIALVIGGFPIALVLAWAFELTPDGMKLTKSVAEGESIAPRTGRKLDYAVLAGLALVAILIIGQKFSPASNRETARAPAGAQSVAVLPFIDLSPNKNEGYFSDGVSEEILNVLARIPKLKVAGRTSSFQFKGKDEDLRLIGNALGVNHVLEGSVRRDGDVVRITAQLVNTKDGFHVWAETYDRKLTDIFEVQDEIARAVADQLALSLGLSKEKLVPDRTSDPKAYEKFLEAKALIKQRGAENLNRALLLLNEVTARDPHFAPAWSQLANVYDLIESYEPAETPAATYLQWRAIGAAAANRAIALSPGDVDAYLALADLNMRELKWADAFKALDLGLEKSGDNPAILDSASQLLTTAGYADKAKGLSEKAIALDPLVGIYHNSLGNAFRVLDENDAAAAEYEKALELSPNVFFAYGNLLRVYLDTGNFEKALLVASKAAAHGFAPPDAVEKMKQLQTIWNDKKALQSFNDSGDDFIGFLIARRLRDDKEIIDHFEESWNEPHQIDPNFLYVPHSAMSEPRWKAKIKSAGLFALWKERGFPTFCKPAGADDFECN